MIDFDGPLPDDASDRQKAIVRAERIRMGMFFSPWFTAIPADVTPLEDLFEGPVRYADTAKRSDIRQVIKGAEEHLALVSEADDSSWIDEVETYLQNPQTVERMLRISRGFAKAMAYLTGGYGSRLILDEIRKAEGKDNGDQ